MEAVVKKTAELEDFGIMTEEWNDSLPTYNLRDLFAYCRRVGIRYADMSE